MKKYFLPILLAATFVFVNTGCDDALDINTDPLAATAVDPNLLFPEVLVNLSNNRTIEVSGRLGNIVHYYEPGLTVFGTMAYGDLSNTFLVGNIWSNWYSIGLKNLVLAEQTALSQDPQPVNVIAQSKLLQSFIYYLLTTSWEEVPFSQALNADEFPNPVFDPQEQVLEGIVAMVDEALALIDKGDGAFSVTDGDLIYGGNMDNWERFGNSLKLKALMLLANKKDVSAQIAAAVAAPRITALSDEAALQYFDAPGNFNPLWNTLNLFAGGNNPEWWNASTIFIDVLNELEDPRLSTYYDESDSFGAPPGSFGVDGNAIVSLNILRPDFPDRYITPAEIVLLEAEAIARGFAPGGIGAADTKYREGIKLSMDFYDAKPGAIQEVDKEAYLNSLPNLAELPTDDAVEAIQLQIYLEDFMRSPEGWTQWRRTKVPSTVQAPAGSQISGVLRRLFYPPDEVGANPNAPNLKDLDEPMWFEN
ncbi:MAG: SusD/RagB family nutrient-binding outer membrane lipoprotein [Bacteroidota bacterium]